MKRKESPLRGAHAFRVHYNNDGSLTAPDVFISLSFHGMTYISDTIGLPHTGNGAPVIRSSGSWVTCPTTM